MIVRIGNRFINLAHATNVHVSGDITRVFLGEADETFLGEESRAVVALLDRYDRLTRQQLTALESLTPDMRNGEEQDD